MAQRGGTAAGTAAGTENVRRVEANFLDSRLAFSQPQAFADVLSSNNRGDLRQMRDQEMMRILQDSAPDAFEAMRVLQVSYAQVKSDGSLHPAYHSAVASYGTTATPIPLTVPLWENRAVLHAASTRLRRRFPAVQRAMSTLHRLYPATDVSAALVVARCSPHLCVLQRAARAQLAAAKERTRDVEEARLDSIADAAEGRLVQVPHVLRQNTAGALKTVAYTKHLVLLRAVRTQRARMFAQARPHRGGAAGGWREEHEEFVEDSDSEEPAVQYPEASQAGVALLRRLAVADTLLDVQFSLDGRVTTMRCVLNHSCGPFSQEKAEEAVDALRGEVLHAVKHYQMTPIALLHKKRLAAVDTLQGSIESELSL